MPATRRAVPAPRLLTELDRPKYPPTFPDATSTLAMRLTTVASAANYLQVTTKTIREYVAEGVLTGYRVGPPRCGRG